MQRMHRLRRITHRLRVQRWLDDPRSQTGGCCRRWSVCGASRLMSSRWWSRWWGDPTRECPWASGRSWAVLRAPSMSRPNRFRGGTLGARVGSGSQGGVAEGSHCSERSTTPAGRRLPMGAASSEGVGRKRAPIRDGVWINSYKIQ